MKRTLIFGALLLAMAVTAIALFVWPASNHPTRPPAAPNATAELSQMLDAAGVPVRAAASTEALGAAPVSDTTDGWWQRPLSEVFDAMLAAANDGDMHAAYALGSRSARCVDLLRERSADTLLAGYRQDMEMMKGRDDPEGIRLANVSNQFRRELQAYEDCAAVGEARLAGYLQWLERAGRAGVTGARVAYAQNAMAEYRGDRNALIANIEQATARRALTRDWLEELVRAGNEDALNVYVEALSGQDGIYAADLTQARAYGYALDLVRSRRVDGFAKLWADGPIRYGDDLTPRQWDEATVRGRQIFRESFEHLPAWPNR